MMDIAKVGNNVLFKAIKAENLPNMLQCLNALEYNCKKGQLIMPVNDNSHLIGLVLKGVVHVINEDIWGRASIVSIVCENDFFGETFDCGAESLPPLNFLAASDCCIVFLDYYKVLHSCSLACVFHHRLIENMVSMLARKNLELAKKIDIISKSTLRQKVYTYLTYYAKSCGGNTFEIPLGRIQLADYLSVDRSSLTRELSNMKADGIIDYYKNSFKILKPLENIYRYFIGLLP